MTTQSAAKTQELRWQYPERDGDAFELRTLTGPVGRLEFHEEPASSVGEYAGQRWTFRYSARLRPHVLVCRADSQEQIAEYIPHLTGGGVVQFTSGPRYRWKRTDLSGAHWCFRTEEQSSSVCLSQDIGPLTKGGKVTVCCGAAHLPETPVLLLLAWFLRIMDFEMLSEGMFRVG